METIYTVIVVILLVLAILGLVVGVSNDAVNFLNSAIGSKAASRKVIFTIASVGILLGTMTSSGMMEVARSGVFYPEMFTFRDVMMLFLGVMFANVILLDLFNTFGLPTSTTVSLVFGLLGAAVAVTSLKISADPTLTAADMSNYINSGKALVIISGILASVAIAFVVGAFVMFISRLIFTFRYQKMLKRFGALWCGIAFTAIAYFALFKGLQDSGIFSPAFFDTLSAHMFPILLGFFAVSSLVMFLLQLAKINILKVTILAGTFSLALAFAGNDLVNFIGVPIAGLDSYKIALAAGGDDGMMMQRNVAYYCLTEPEGNQDDLPEEGIGKYGRLGLEPLGTLEGEREYTYDYRFTIPTHEPIDHNLDNCRLVYFICKADATIEPYGYFCANAATCRLGQSQEYEFEPIYGE